MKTYELKVDNKWSIRWNIKNNHFHCEDGPAVEISNGTKFWLKNGKFHREDGPAIENPDGTKYWFLNGEELSEEEFLNQK